MEKRSDLIGTRQSDLKKSFNLAVRSLLTSCSKEEFTKAFSSFSRAEQESLHRLFIQIITSLNKIVEDEFETLCLETQAGTTLDFVEQLIEEQSLDPLYGDKSNLMDAAHNLSLAKKNEINYLMGILERAEEQKRSIRDRVELLKKGRQEITGTNKAVEKIRCSILNYGTSSKWASADISMNGARTLQILWQLEQKVALQEPRKTQDAHQFYSKWPDT